MGYPINWTSTTQPPAAEPERNAGTEDKFLGASLFSGIAGLDLAAAKAVTTKVYCESDEAARKRIAGTHQINAYSPKGP